MDEFLEPTPQARRGLLLLLAASLAVGAVTIHYATPAYFDFLRGLPQCEQLRWAAWTLDAAVGGMAFFSIWFWVIGFRILRHDRWPLPGTWVWHRQRIRYGAAVRWRGYVLIVMAAVCVAFAAYGILLIEQFRARHELRACAPDDSFRTARSARSNRPAFPAPAREARGTT